MDEGKRLPEAKSYAYLAGVTVDRNAEYVDVNGDYKLRLKAQMDRGTYIKLPSDWASKPYYKPTKITFTVSKDSSGSMAFKSLKLASAIENSYAPSGETHDIITSTSYINPTTFSLNITENMYDCFYIAGQLYATSSWSETVDSYVLYDDVTIDYEYDFDYIGYDVTIDGEKKATIAEGDTYTVPTPAEGSYYTDGTNTYVGGEEITVTAPVELTSKLYEYDVTVDGEVVATIAYGGTYTVEDIENYYITDGTTKYYGGEEITVTGPVALTTKPETSSVVYTMDPGSRIAGGSTNACSPSGEGEYVEVDGDWVFALPTRPDQETRFILPEYWYEKANCKAVGIEFSVSRTANAAPATQLISFTDGTDSISISNGYADFNSKYSFAVDESNYGYRTIKMHLKGGTNFDANGRDYIYIDDVTVNFEYDPNYVAPVFHKVTIDGVEVAEVRDGETFVLPAVAEGMQYAGGFVVGQEFVVTEALSFTTEKIPEFAGETTTVVKTDTAASIRLNEVNGIRFYTQINVDAFNALVEGKDYELKYSNNINVGLGKVTVTGIGEYEGSVDKTFKIKTVVTAPKTIKVKISKTKFVYNGKVQKPKVTVKANGVELTRDNYTVKFSKGCKKVGKYSVIVTLSGNYSGTVTKTFTINPKSTKINKLLKGKKSITVKFFVCKYFSKLFSGLLDNLVNALLYPLTF